MARGEYAHYLRSPAWHRKRTERLVKDRHRCRKCGSKERLEVHHLTYDRVGGNEQMSDLWTLCQKCHAGVHGAKPKKNPRAIPKYRAPKRKTKLMGSKPRPDSVLPRLLLNLLNPRYGKSMYGHRAPTSRKALVDRIERERLKGGFSKQDIAEMLVALHEDE